MTTTPARAYDDQRVHELLRVYAEIPLEDGDAILVLDDAVCVEVKQLAEHWDEVVRSSTASLVTARSRRVVLAVARQDCTLHESDFQMWRELHEELRDTQVELRPVRALPAA